MGGKAGDEQEPTGGGQPREGGARGSSRGAQRGTCPGAERLLAGADADSPPHQLLEFGKFLNCSELRCFNHATGTSFPSWQGGCEEQQAPG